MHYPWIVVFHGIQPPKCSVVCDLKKKKKKDGGVSQQIVPTEFIAHFTANASFLMMEYIFSLGTTFGCRK